MGESVPVVLSLWALVIGENSYRETGSQDKQRCHRYPQQQQQQRCHSEALTSGWGTAGSQGVWLLALVELAGLVLERILVGDPVLSSLPLQWQVSAGDRCCGHIACP